MQKSRSISVPGGQSRETINFNTHVDTNNYPVRKILLCND